MIERLKRYNKQIMALICALIVFVSGVLSTSFNSKAVGTSSTYVFDVTYPEPYCSDTSGYLSILFSNSSGTTNYLYTYFWTLTPLGGSNASSEFASSVMNITVTYEGITFTPSVQGSLNYSLSFGRYNGSDAYETVYNGITNSFSFHNPHGSSFPIKGYLKGGNAQLTSQTTLNTVSTPEVHWSDSVDASTLYSYMQSILNICSSLESDCSDILSRMADIYEQSVEMNVKLEEMRDLLNSLLQEQEVTNSWLSQIKAVLDIVAEALTVTSEKKEEVSQKQEEQKETLENLNGKNNVEKVDINASSGDTDSYLDSTSINNYGTVLAIFTNDSYILSCILFVLSVGLVGYVLFGKKR